MSISIRLAKTGKRGEKKFRIVVQTTRKKLKGGAIDILGFVDRQTNTIKIDQERLKHWLSKGAKASASLEKVIKDSA